MFLDRFKNGDRRYERNAVRMVAGRRASLGSLNRQFVGWPRRHDKLAASPATTTPWTQTFGPNTNIA
jgi:hypothetical protein